MHGPCKKVRITGRVEVGDRLYAHPPVGDGCTESNCPRCMTHPEHRGGMKHAGIGIYPPVAAKDEIIDHMVGTQLSIADVARQMDISEEEILEAITGEIDECYVCNVWEQTDCMTEFCGELVCEDCH